MDLHGGDRLLTNVKSMLDVSLASGGVGSYNLRNLSPEVYT